MPADYRRDTAGWPVIGLGLCRGRMGPRQGARRKPLDRRASPPSTDCPRAVVAWCDLAEPGAAELPGRPGGDPDRARHPAQAGRGGEARGGEARSARLDGRSRLARRLRPAGAQRPVLRSADAVVASRRGGRTGARRARHADHRQPYRPALRSQPRGAGGLAAGAGDWRRRSPTSRSRSPALAGPASPGRKPATGRSSATRSRSSASSGRCSPAISPSTGWSAISIRSFRVSSQPTADRSEDDRRKLFHDNAARFYRL